jgi:hypothetical protein
VLISPADSTDPDCPRSWIWNTGTGSLEELVIGAPEWDLHPIPFATILTGLAEGWARDRADLERAAVEVARLEEKVLDIRQYAIDKHLAGHYCREGLNEGLEHFGLEPYLPRYRVQVTVSATFELNADGADRAYNRVRYLVDGLRYSGDRDDDDLEVSEQLTVVDAAELAAS